jgi:hypothetical protein
MADITEKLMNLANSEDQVDEQWIEYACEEMKKAAILIKKLREHLYEERQDMDRWSRKAEHAVQAALEAVREYPKG